MKAKIKAIVAMVLSLCMITACGNQQTVKEETKTSTVTSESSATSETKREESKYPEYLNLDSFRPIVKEGEKITLKVVTQRATGATTNIEETWIVKFIEEKLNIDLEIEELTGENVAERKNLLLASGDLPDLFLTPLANGDVVEYGVNGGELLPIGDYISEELTPNIWKFVNDEANEEAVKAATASDGKMYSVPTKVASTPGNGDTIGQYRVFIDKDYLAAAGVEELPTTLDGFVDFLRTIKKEVEPSEVGVNEFWPLVARSGHDRLYFQNAFGWVTSAPDEATAPCWDAETQSVAVPCLTEKYAEYIKLYHTLYSEGLLHPDYFTMDKTASRALYAEGKAAVNTDAAPYLFDREGFANYVLAEPLTSKWSAAEPAVTSLLSYTVNVAFISADTEYPEVCLRLLDWFYSDEGLVYTEYGAPEGSEDTMNMVSGFYYDKDANIVTCKEVASGAWDSTYNFKVNNYSLSQYMVGLSINGEKNVEVLYEDYLGLEAPSDELDITQPDPHYRWLCYNAMNEHLIYPLAAPYMTAEQNTEFTDLKSVLENYLDQEFAKFVVGQRPIEEVDKLLDELMDLGGKEYLELVKEIYGE